MVEKNPTQGQIDAALKWASCMMPGKSFDDNIATTLAAAYEATKRELAVKKEQLSRYRQLAPKDERRWTEGENLINCDSASDAVDRAEKAEAELGKMSKKESMAINELDGARNRIKNLERDLAEAAEELLFELGERQKAEAARAEAERLREAATKWPRCCDLWQDSLGGMHCTECAQKTFAMMREVYSILGVDKDGKALSQSPAEGREKNGG